MAALSTIDAPSRPALGHNLPLGLVGVLGLAIVAEEFPRGVLPTEPELERRFAVSRSVVREAVKMLAAKGWSSHARARELSSSHLPRGTCSIPRYCAGW